MAEFLAGGGEMRAKNGGSDFRYTNGALKGKNHNEAKSVFERMWAGAAPGVKDKYARREMAEGVLAPVEMEGYQQDVAASKMVMNQDGTIGFGGGKIRSNTEESVKANNTAKIGNFGMMEVDAKNKARDQERQARMNTGAPAVPTSATPAVATTPVTATPKIQQLGTPSRAALVSAGQVATPETRAAAQAYDGGKPSPAVEPKIPAIAPTPAKPMVDTGGADMSKPVRINPATGLPFGYMPGDPLPDQSRLPQGTSMDSVKSLADASVARQSAASKQEADRVAALPKPEMGKPYEPPTRFGPEGVVAVAKPVTNGDEQISYDAYRKAKETKRGTGATTFEEDRANGLLEIEYERQQMKKLGRNDIASRR